jgi:hypothetical protein
MYQTFEGARADAGGFRGPIAELAFGRAAIVVARLSFCFFTILTSVYCLLAYIPFTYQWVIGFNLVSWLPGFVRFHPYLYWLVLGLAAVTFTPDIRRKQTRRLAVGFLFAHTLLGVGLLFRPVLPGLQNDGISFVWSLVWLFPLLWIAAIDCGGAFNEVRWAAVVKRDGHLLLSALLTAIFVAALNAALVFTRPTADGIATFGWGERLLVIGWSFGSHLFLFAVLFISLKVISAISGRFKRGARIEFVLCHLLAIVLLAVIIRNVVLQTVAFNNRLADLYSLAVSSSLVICLMGLRLKLQRVREETVSNGLELALGAVTLPALSSIPGRLMGIAVVLLFAWFIPSYVAMRDWDFLFQRLSVIAIWPISFAACFRIVSGIRGRLSPVFLFVLFGAAGGYMVADTWQSRAARISGGDVYGSATLDRYAARDLSFRVIREIFSTSTDDGEFYQYLRSYTNILPSTRVAPVQVNLVEDLKRTEGERPNIFVLVVDSLRRDYLSPYNPRVDFTPNIEQFARESVVMENAFTRYGGTALSEPAIWAGAMLLHKQYVLPFYPMNSLQRLLDTDGYQSFISVDPILKELLRPSAAIVDLENRDDSHKFDLCYSLKELENKLDQRDGSDPVFAYTQPWNIHTHVIAVEGRSVAGGREFPGFWAPYASRVQYMDACLGEFVEYLKTRGLYENSVVVLTSDHGDALGDDGRWGHSYWVYPEIMRIPLIVHLPAKLRSRLTWDPKLVAFSTDITPTLYYLLGHKPILANRLFGKPLFVETEQERREYSRDSYVIASSYGAAYGVVSGNGRWLFVADGVKDKDHFFDLSDEGEGRLDHFTSARRIEQRQLLRDYIASINEFYNLTQKPQTAGAFDMGRQGRPAGDE